MLREQDRGDLVLLQIQGRRSIPSLLWPGLLRLSHDGGVPHAPPPDDADSGTGEYPCVDLRYGNGSGASGLKTTVSAQVVSLDVRQNEVSLQDFGFVLVDLRNCTSCSFPRPTFFTLVPKNQCLAAPRGTGNEPGVSGSDPGTEARVIYSEVSAAKYSVLRYGNPRCSGAPTAVTHYAYGSCDQDREALASRFAVESPGAASALADYWERFGAEVSDVPLGLGIGVGGDAVGATAGAAKKMETARGGGQAGQRGGGRAPSGGGPWGDYSPRHRVRRRAPPRVWLALGGFN